MLSTVSTAYSPLWLDGRNWQAGGTGVHSYVHAVHDTIVHEGLSASILCQDTTGRERGKWARLSRLPRALMLRNQSMAISPHGGLFAQDLFSTAHSRFKTRGILTKLHASPPTALPRIMHWTAPLPVTLAGVANVVTVHDLIPLTHPELTGINPARHERLLRSLFSSVEAIATVSDTVRIQLIEQFGVPPESVTNLYQPVSFDPDLLSAAHSAEPVVPDGGFVCIGRVESRKNIDRLLMAHSLSRTARALSIIGPDGDDRPDCTPRGRTSHVVRIPWCDKVRLLRTIMGARAVLFPSLAEGFGLPIIEAMALGTPVMTSFGGATEEIAGGAALLVDPLSVSSIADGISVLDSEQSGDELCAGLRERGFERAGHFGHESFARRLLSFYRGVTPDFGRPDLASSTISR